MRECRGQYLIKVIVIVVSVYIHRITNGLREGLFGTQSFDPQLQDSDFILSVTDVLYSNYV